MDDSADLMTIEALLAQIRQQLETTNELLRQLVIEKKQ
jgi:hypothetical protein